MQERIYLCLAHMSGQEMKFIKEAFDTNWVVPLGPNVNGFEKDLEEFCLTPNPSPTGEGNFGGEGSSFTRRLLVSDQDVMGEAESIVGRRLNSCNQKSEDCITTRDIAEQYGMDARDLNSFLKDQGIQRWKRGQFRLTPEYEGRGLAEDRLFVYYSKDGKQKERTYLVWTKKGAEMISNILKN